MELQSIIDCTSVSGPGREDDPDLLPYTITQDPYKFHNPTPADISAVHAMLARTLLRPAELRLLALDYAEYYPHAYARRTQPVHYTPNELNPAASSPHRATIAGLHMVSPRLPSTARKAKSVTFQVRSAEHCQPSSGVGVDADPCEKLEECPRQNCGVAGSTTRGPRLPRSALYSTKCA